MTKIDAFAHILPPSYAERLEAITAGPVSDRIIGYRPWIREAEEAAIFGGNATRLLRLSQPPDEV